MGAVRFADWNPNRWPHVLWQCGVAQDIWAGSIRKLQKSITEQPEFMQMVEGLTQKLTEKEQELF